MKFKFLMSEDGKTITPFRASLYQKGNYTYWITCSVADETLDICNYLPYDASVDKIRKLACDAILTLNEVRDSGRVELDHFIAACNEDNRLYDADDFRRGDFTEVEDLKEWAKAEIESQDLCDKDLLPCLDLEKAASVLLKNYNNTLLENGNTLIW
ncbi:MAG: hypothetical protein NC114_11845 [Ruminococcus flavefaciens]|nr:hypothetical protein [Ruminococcus flavefaciens]